MKEYSKLEKIIFKKRYLLEVKSELERIQNLPKMLFNTRDVNVCICGIGPCAVCNKIVEYHESLAPGEERHIFCKNCRSIIMGLTEECDSLEEKHKTR